MLERDDFACFIWITVSLNSTTTYIFLTVFPQLHTPIVADYSRGSENTGVTGTVEIWILTTPITSWLEHKIYDYLMMDFDDGL